MTDARLKPSPAQGHGMTTRVTDAIYSALSVGKPTERVLAVVLLEPVEHGERRTADGTKRWVRFEAVRLEPITDAHDAETVRHLMTVAHDARHSGQTLPLDFGNRSDEEQRGFLLTALDEWATENDIDLTDAWWTYYDQEHVAAPDKASAVQLREFALAKGAIAEDGPTPALADGAGRTEADDDEDDEDGGEVVAFSDSRKAQAGDRT